VGCVPTFSVVDVTRKDSQGRRLCTATTNKGEPCRGPARKGATVCRKHGGSLPEVKAKAARNVREAIGDLVDPVLAKFRDMLEDPKTPAAVKVSIGNSILDRAGFKPVIQVQGMPTVAVLDEWLEELEAEVESE